MENREAARAMAEGWAADINKKSVAKAEQFAVEIIGQLRERTRDRVSAEAWTAFAPILEMVARSSYQEGYRDAHVEILTGEVPEG